MQRKIIIAKLKNTTLISYSDEYKEACIEVFHKVYCETYTYLESKYMQTQRFRDLFIINTVPNSDIYILRKNKQVIGFLSIYENIIENFYILSKFQNKGLGSLTIEKIKELYPQKLGVHVLMSNYKGIKFFEKHGFKIITEGISPDENQPDFFMSL